MKPSNLLKIETLNDEWLDKDMIILHACFQILSDCIEKKICSQVMLIGHMMLNIKMQELKLKTYIIGGINVRLLMIIWKIFNTRKIIKC